MGDPYRFYRHFETPHAGDVIRCFDGSFGTAVVISVTPESIVVMRPYIVADRSGAIKEGSETFEILKDRAEVYTYHGKPYNLRGENT